MKLNGYQEWKVGRLLSTHGRPLSKRTTFTHALQYFQGTNSVVSSLSSINSYGSERSLNLSDMANNAKMSKLLKIFEGKRYQDIIDPTYI